MPAQITNFKAYQAYQGGIHEKRRFLIIGLAVVYFVPAGIVYGAQNTPIFHISKILVWGDQGMITLINGREGCTAIGNSIAIPGTMNVVDR